MRKMFIAGALALAAVNLLCVNTVAVAQNLRSISAGQDAAAVDIARVKHAIIL
jgi:hypothetical protein